MKKILILVLDILFCTVAFGGTDRISGNIPSDEGLFPFNISYTMADGVTDFSSLLDAPAGKHGFIRVEGRHFVNDKGRIRFNGLNVLGGACFPSHEVAERMARRMAHFGFNIARIHFYDAVTYRFGNTIKEKCLLVDDGTWMNFDPEQLDKFDYMIYQFKENGVYVNINLMVGRPFKDLNALDPDIQQKELEFARKILTHKNPYTGLSLAEDPCMAVVELNNENSLFPNYSKATEYGFPSMDEIKAMDADRKKEVFDKIEAADRNHWKLQKDFLEKELGVKVPITATQVSWTTPWALADMDYFDMHGYWHYPDYCDREDEANFYNLPMVNEADCGLCQELSCYRPADRPYTVSEFNHTFPMLYGAEGPGIMHAQAAYQGWDGFTCHSYNNMTIEPDYVPYVFTFCSRTDALAHMIACATMFLREDVKESKTETVLDIPRDFIREGYGSIFRYNVSGNVDNATKGRFKGAQYFMHRSAVNFNATEVKDYPEEEVPAIKFSDTGELEWNLSIADRGMFFARTKNTKFFTGFPDGRSLDFGDGVTVTVGETKLGWTTISMVSNTCNGFKKNSDALLVATGYTKNTDQKFSVEKDENGNPLPFIHSRRENWGHGPVLNEGIPAVVNLASRASKTRCWALDESGARKCEVPVRAGKGGKAVIEIDAKYKTIWYEIQVGKQPRSRNKVEYSNGKRV